MGCRLGEAFREGTRSFREVLGCQSWARAPRFIPLTAGRARQLEWVLAPVARGRAETRMTAARLSSPQSGQPLRGSAVSPGSSCRGCEMWRPGSSAPGSQASVWGASGPGFLLLQHVLRRVSVCAARSRRLFPSETTRFGALPFTDSPCQINFI